MPAHQSVLARLQEWAHELVCKYWRVKENAFEALVQSAMKKSGVANDAPRPPRGLRSQGARNALKRGPAAKALLGRAPRTDEERELVRLQKMEVEIEDGTNF